MKEYIISAISLGVLALTVFTFGTVNETYDGLLVFIHVVFQILLSIAAAASLLMIAILNIMSEDEFDEKVEKGDWKAFADLRTPMSYVRLVVMFAAYVGTYVTLEWGGLMYWYITNAVIANIFVAMLRKKVRDSMERLGMTDEDSDDSEDLSELLD